MPPLWGLIFLLCAFATQMPPLRGLIFPMGAFYIDAAPMGLYSSVICVFYTDAAHGALFFCYARLLHRCRPYEALKKSIEKGAVWKTAPFRLRHTACAYYFALLQDDHFSHGRCFVGFELVEIETTRYEFAERISSIPIRCTIATGVVTCRLMSEF